MSDMILEKKQILNFTKKVKLKSIINEKHYMHNTSTPSIIKYKDWYIINIRVPGYYFDKDFHFLGYYYQSHMIQNNKTIILDKSFEVVKNQMIKLNKNLNDWPRNFHVGVEDLRLFNDKVSEQLLFIGTIGESQKKWKGYRTECGFGVYTLTGESLIINRLIKENKKRIDKNWVFYNYKKDDKWKLKIIYEWYPLLRIYDIKESDNKSNWNLQNEIIIKVPERFKNFRGSTCGYNYKNEIWFICHKVYGDYKKLGRGACQYYHIFIVFDHNMKLLRYSDEINFGTKNVEYCCGIIVEDDRVFVTYSELDKTSKVAIYDKDYIDSLFIYKGNL